MRRTVFIPFIVLTVLLVGCKSTYYKTMRTLGKEKRDILVSRIKDAKKDQDQTKKQLQTTMESFQALTGFKGGSLEKSYKRLNSDYESAASQAGKLHDKIQSIDQVSNDLFKEWQGEINDMDNVKLKSQDLVMLRNAKTRQATYMRAMRSTEDQIAPVLKAFQDQVLFLKHNLNSRAIGSLKTTSSVLQSDVAGLIKSIDASSQEADKLITSLAASDDTK
ncbi:MAG: hypothetical protein QOJ42_7092 [Acidobacteriaceae bacterium]|nr:hypothetical protein [Acidobacteriaceae bacterium]